MENAAPHEILTGRFRTLGHHKLEAIQPLHRELSKHLRFRHSRSTRGLLRAPSLRSGGERSQCL